MKRFACLFIVVAFLVGCAGFSNLSGAEKADAVAYYYETFLTGVDAAVPWLKAYFPTAAETIDKVLCPTIALAKTALAGYKNAVVLYKAGSLSWEQALLKQQEIYNVIQAINQLVGQIKALKVPAA